MNGAGFMRQTARRFEAKYLHANDKQRLRIVKQAWHEPYGGARDQWLSQSATPKEKAMSRKIILALAAVATLAGAALSSGNANAMVVRRVGVGNPGHPHINVHWRFHEHRHFVRWHNHIWVRPVGYAVRGVETAVQPGPCTCLTKNYTPEGMVVFQDLCTKEMASAPADGTSDQAQAAQGPANYAGQTYQDYLKANPQAETKKN
jgi:hypothetical protein